MRPNETDPPTKHEPPDADSKHGVLYVVATPIGNMEDITLRALRILGEADLIAAEDTRHTARLLKWHNLNAARMISCHEHNEEQRSGELIKRLKNGENIALVSNAGTPSVSDPGYRLILECVTENIKAVPIPGVSSAVAALCVSGLPTDSFVFLGFPPRKRGKREKLFGNLAGQTRTMVFFESPKRIPALLDDLISSMGDRQAVLAREMTKIHEEFIRGTLADIKNQLECRDEIKGECTLLVQGANAETRMTEPELRREIQNALQKPGEKLSSAVKKIAERHGVSRKRVYDEALKIKKQT